MNNDGGQQEVQQLQICRQALSAGCLRSQSPTAPAAFAGSVAPAQLIRLLPSSLSTLLPLRGMSHAGLHG